MDSSMAHSARRAHWSIDSFVMTELSIFFAQRG